MDRQTDTLMHVFSPQLAYQTWVSSVKTALRERQRHLRTKKEKDSQKGKGKVDFAVTVTQLYRWFKLC